VIGGQFYFSVGTQSGFIKMVLTKNKIKMMQLKS